jgi:soluble lytic murein transglycosylase-like protein
MMVKTRRQLGLLAGFMALACLSASADQNAILSNGASIRHERREVRDDMTRLFLPGEKDNFIDVPTADIVGFEEIQAPPAQPIAAAEKTVSHGSTAIDLGAVVSAAGNRNNINPDLIISMIHVESGFNPRAVSPKGAQGLMQLMPQTAARLGVANPMDPVANVEGGTRYIRELLDRYHSDLIKALAAYNAGPERVEQFNGVPPYPETIAYVTKVIKEFNSRTPKSVPQKEKATSVVQKRRPNLKAAVRVTSSQNLETAKQSDEETAADPVSGS